MNDALVANNRRYADALADTHLAVRPARALAIVTCMHSRLNVFAALGLQDGDAHVLRTAGGVITDDVIRSLAISQRQLGTCEIMLIHHTDCGCRRSRTMVCGGGVDPLPGDRVEERNRCWIHGNGRNASGA